MERREPLLDRDVDGRLGLKWILGYHQVELAYEGITGALNAFLNILDCYIRDWV
jgi:hypothetical protein